MEDGLQRLKREILSCRRCSLWKGRINPVVGEGSAGARTIFIGEAPGANEDKTGRPFCGEAGKVLDELLSEAGIKRQDIYITNILKCRPPGNRNPKEEEIRACSPYLEGQIEIIKPKIFCCLGNFATKYIMERFGLQDKIKGISKIHGQVFPYRSSSDSIKIVPLYHPAVVTYNINMKKTLKMDFNALRRI